MPIEVRSKVQRDVLHINGEKTVLEATELMIDKHVGSVVISGSGVIEGIFTERDLMKRVVAKRVDPAMVKIKDVMTKDLITINPEDSATKCLQLMKENNCRHMLVFEDGSLYGILSLRDMLLLMVGEKEELLSYLERYVKGEM